MKILTLFLSLFLVPAAHAGPITLLDCQMEYAPITRAILFSLQGKLILATYDTDGQLVSQYIREEDWAARILTIVDKPGMKGVLFFRDGNWNATFKGDNGWYMAGGANCGSG